MPVSAKIRKLSSLLFTRDKISPMGPATSRVVIFDNPYLAEMRPLVGQESTCVFDPRYETKLFLAPFVKGFLKWVFTGFSLSLTHHYFVSFLRSTKPDLVMTAAFDNLNFYSARKSISKSSTARFAVFQRGPLPIETLNKATESGGLLPRDAVFCYTDTFAKEWNTGGAEMISSGTLLSKVHINQSDQEKLTSRVGFISSYQHYGDAINGPPSVAESVFYKPEIAMLRPLLDSMNKLGYELDIIGRCVGDITKEEHAFYETHLGQKGWRLLPRQIKIGSYKVLAQYPMIFSAASTLGLEALSSHLRVMFLDMTSAANYRDHFWSTSESSLRHSRLLLREKEITTWENQVLELLKVDDLAFELLAQAVVGKGPMTTSFDDIQAKIKLMLGQ